MLNLGNEGDYEEVSRSSFFPGLDLALLLRYVAHPDKYDAVQEFQAVIRGECAEKNL
jgi:6,7-dimethyl-8-ribityllumazine synthase